MGTDRQASGKAPPIPEAGPLASPRSLQQTGLPAEVTREVTPPDNPQTFEAMAQVIGRPDLLSDDRFCTPPARAKNAANRLERLNVEGCFEQGRGQNRTRRTANQQRPQVGSHPSAAVIQDCAQRHTEWDFVQAWLAE